MLKKQVWAVDLFLGESRYLVQGKSAKEGEDIGSIVLSIHFYLDDGKAICVTSA